jgi:hypothetical protein
MTMKAFWAAMIAILGGLLFWRNTVRYRHKSGFWRIGKSALEMVLLVATAQFLPGMLIAWLVLWATRPIQNGWLKTVVGVVSGITFGFLNNIFAELLVLFGVFAVEIKTGEEDKSGLINCYRRVKAKNEMKVAA